MISLSLLKIVQSRANIGCRPWLNNWHPHQLSNPWELKFGVWFDNRERFAGISNEIYWLRLIGLVNPQPAANLNRAGPSAFCSSNIGKCSTELSVDKDAMHDTLRWKFGQLCPRTCISTWSRTRVTEKEGGSTGRPWWSFQLFIRKAGHKLKWHGRGDLPSVLDEVNEASYPWLKRLLLPRNKQRRQETNLRPLKAKEAIRSDQRCVKTRKPQGPHLIGRN